jgi:hypothetical protein
MKRLSKKWLWLAAAGALLLLLCAWLFGWFRGNINMMRFSSDEVDRIKLYSTDVRLGLHTSVVTNKEEIQALIDSVNSFQHTGSGLKEIFKYGIGVGGSTLYVCDVYLLNGENFNLHFSSNDGGQPLFDMEMSYWVHWQGKTPALSNTCRGSLELFAELYGKYCPAG